MTDAIGMAGTGRRRLQAGQSLTEFLVASLALAPLFLLMPMIGKYQDIGHSVQLASRYAAFDAMSRNDLDSAWKPEAQLADEVRRRFFGNSDAPVKTRDVAGEFDAHRNLFWVDPVGKPLIREFADVRITYGTAGGANHSGGFEAASDKQPFLYADPLQLRSHGIYTVNVAVKLARLPAGLKFHEPFDQLDLSMTRGTSVLIAPWTATGPQQVEDRMGASAAVFPAQALADAGEPAGALIGLVEAPGEIPGPRLGRLEFWRDVVPADRLKNRP